MATYTNVGGFLECVGVDITSAGIKTAIDGDGTLGTAIGSTVGNKDSYTFTMTTGLRIGNVGSTGGSSIWDCSNEFIVISGPLDIYGRIKQGSISSDISSNGGAFSVNASNDAFRLRQFGEFLAYGCCLYSTGRIRLDDDNIFHMIDCDAELEDSVALGQDGAGAWAASNCDVSYKRSRIHHTSAVGVKLYALASGNTFNIDGVRVEACLYAYQLGSSSFLSPVVKDAKIDSCTNHTVPNVGSNSNVVFINPDFTTLRSALYAADDITTIAFRFNFEVQDSGLSPLSGASVYIVDQNSTVVSDGNTDVSGKIDSLLPTYDSVVCLNNSTFAGVTKTNREQHTVSSYKYGFLPRNDVFSVNVDIALNASILDDSNVVLSKAAADALTTLDDDSEIYDRHCSFIEDNWGTYTDLLLDSPGSYGAIDLIIDATAVGAFAYSATGDGTITAKSSEFTGGATGTSGEVTLSNGVLLNGGTFDVPINIDNGSDGDTYTNLTAIKIFHSGTGTRTLTLDGGDVDEIEVTGGVDLTVTLTNGAAIPTLTQTSGTITLINDMTVNVTGLTIGDTIRVSDDTGAQQEYTMATGTSYQFTISRDNDGESWKVAVDRAGYAPDVSTFTVAEGTTLEVNVTLNEYIRFEGDPMYAGATCPLCTISFDFVTPQATIDIGDGIADLQAVFDEVEDELLTSDGMRWHAEQGSVTKYDDLPGLGKVLGLGQNWRVRRANAGDVNAGVNGYLLSEDSQPIDGSNGSVAYIPSTSTDIATILANTNRVDGLIEDVGGDRYTSKALEEGPAGGTGTTPAAVWSYVTRGLTEDVTTDAASRTASQADVSAIETKAQADTRQSALIAEHNTTQADISNLNDFDPTSETVTTDTASRDASKADVSALGTKDNQVVINEGVKKSSLIIPHSANLPDT
jgi:hypothetical protein